MPVFRNPATKVVVSRCPCGKPRAHPLALAGTPVAAGHVRRRPGFINEHEPVGVQTGLSVEPVETSLQDVRAILFGRVSGLFFRVIPWRRKNRHSDEVEAAMPRSDSCLQSSASVISGVSSGAAWITRALASILRDRMSPPWGFGKNDPVDRRSISQRIAVDGATPYRAAAARRLRPASIALINLSLSSMESGLPIVAPEICVGSVKQAFTRMGIRNRSRSVGERSKASCGYVESGVPLSGLL